MFFFKVMLCVGLIPAVLNPSSTFFHLRQAISTSSQAAQSGWAQLSSIARPSRTAPRRPAKQRVYANLTLTSASTDPFVTIGPHKAPRAPLVSVLDPPSAATAFALLHYGPSSLSSVPGTPHSGDPAAPVGSPSLKFYPGGSSSLPGPLLTTGPAVAPPPLHSGGPAAAVPADSGPPPVHLPARSHESRSPELPELVVTSGPPSPLAAAEPAVTLAPPQSGDPAAAVPTGPSLLPVDPSPVQDADTPPPLPSLLATETAGISGGLFSEPLDSPAPNEDVVPLSEISIPPASLRNEVHTKPLTDAAAAKSHLDPLLAVGIPSARDATLVPTVVSPSNECGLRFEKRLQALEDAQNQASMYAPIQVDPSHDSVQNHDFKIRDERLLQVSEAAKKQAYTINIFVGLAGLAVGFLIPIVYWHWQALTFKSKPNPVANFEAGDGQNPLPLAIHGPQEDRPQDAAVAPAADVDPSAGAPTTPARARHRHGEVLDYTARVIMTMLSSRPAATSPLVYPSGLQGYNKDNTIFASSSQPTAAGSFALRSPRAARHVTSLVPGTPTRSQDQLAVDVKALVVQELDRLEVQYKQGSPGFNELNDEDNDEPPRISVLSMARRYTAAAAAAEAEKAKGKQRELETTAPDGGPLFGFGYVRDVVEVWAQGAPGIVETSPWGRVRRVGEPVSGVVVAPADMRPIESFFGEAARA